MILTINHETVYRCDTSATYSTQYLRLTPQDGEGQRVLEWRLELPSPAFTTTDSHGNVLHVLTLGMPHNEIRIRAVGMVEADEGERMSFSGSDAHPYRRTTALTTMSPEMVAFAEDFRESPVTVAGVERLSHAVHSSGHRYDEHQASHVWADGRWWSLDVVDRCRVYDAHLKLAVGMDYLDTCPVRGVRLGGGAERMGADVRVMVAQSDRSEVEKQQQQ